MARRNPATTASSAMKRRKLQRAARGWRPTATARPCATAGAERGAETSALQTHAGEHRRRLVRGAAEVGLQPVLPHFGFEPDVAVELVDHPDRREVAVVEAPFAHIIVLPVADLQRADQPAPEGVIDLERD